jgi:flavin reductase (DIM6/NTAB) family NADH-FMN oxidoreductase RutF
MGRFASGVTIVTARVGEIDHAMTANAFASVSLEPMLVLVCVEQEARFHDAVMAAGQWGVSVLDGSGRAASEWLATRGRPLHGQLDRIPHHYGPVTGAALLEQSLATMECRTVGSFPGGDHTIVVGEVLAIGTRDSDDGGLIHFRGRYDRIH